VERVVPTSFSAFDAAGPFSLATQRFRRPAPPVHEIKDTQRALVRIGYDGRVHKTFRGPNAAERFNNEIKSLRHLEARGCTFVPKLLSIEPDQLKIITTNCGQRVDHLSDEKRGEIFAELEKFGVRHDDPEQRNITYRITDGRFCVIDFEFSTLI
jgi:tRNA A-37 threonylcarbamoyl transferase component Bud32